MLLFDTVILMFWFDREGLKLVSASTLVTDHASGWDTRISMSISKKINQETWHTKGSARWSKWHSSLSYQGRPRAGHHFDIRHLPLHCVVMGWDGMDSITLKSFLFDCQCNMQVDSSEGVRHWLYVLFCFFIAELKFIILLYNLSVGTRKQDTRSLCCGFKYY